MKRIFYNLFKFNWEIILLIFLFLLLIQNAIDAQDKNNNSKEINKIEAAHRSRPYIGIEAGFISEMLNPLYSFDAFRKGYGVGLHQKNPMLYGLFLGKNLNDFISLEIGYETQHKNERVIELGAGDTLPGRIIIPANNSIIIKTIDRTEYWNAGLKFKIKDYENNKLILWGKAGMSYAQIRASQEILADEHGILPPQDRRDLTRTFKSKKLIPSAQLGFDYSLSKNLAMRIFCGFKNLKLLKAKPKERPTGESEIKLKDSIQLSLGLTYII